MIVEIKVNELVDLELGAAGIKKEENELNE